MENIRDRIEVWFTSFALVVCRRPWLFLLLSVLAVTAMVSQIPGIKIDTSAEGLLHKDDPSLITYDAFRRQFGREQMVIIGLQPKEVFDTGFLRTLKRFHEALEQEVPFLDDVTSLANAEYIYGKDDDIIVEDVLHELPRNSEELARLKSLVLSNPLYRDTIISEDGSFTLVIVKPVLLSPAETNGPPARLSEKEISEFINGINRVIDRFRSPGFPVHISGDLAVEEILKSMTLNTMVRFTLLSTLIIIAVFAVLFRRVSGVVLPLIVVNFALYSTLGLMAAFGRPITLNTTVLPSFLLAVGIGDSVHILAIYYKHLRLTRDKVQAISFALGHSGLAIVMTSLTTASGLLSFVSSGISPVADLGIFAAVGVMMALVFTLVALPALLAVTPSWKKHREPADMPAPRLDSFLSGIGDFASGRPWSVVIVSAALFLAAFTLALQLKFTHNSLLYLKEDVPARVDTELIDRKMNGSVNVDIVVDTGRPSGLYEPELLKKIEHVQELTDNIRVEGRPIGRATSVVDIVKDINQALYSGRASEYRVPESRELIAQELLLYEAGGGKNMDEYMDRDYSKARVTFRMPWVDAVVYAQFLNDFEKKVQRLFEGQAKVTMTGLAFIVVRTLAVIIRSMGQSYLIAGLVITVLMILLMGSIRIGLFSMAPNFLPIVMGLGFMKMTGIPLDYSTIMVGGIAIGLAVDDTVHFMHNFRRYFSQSGDAREAVRRTLTTSGRAMLFTTIILGAGFFILLLADLKSTFNFGLITGFTICMALLADFLLAPAIMTLLMRKRGKPR